MTTPEHLLLHISGKDSPGILAEVLNHLTSHALKLIDVQQTTTLGQLSMSIQVEVTPEHGLGVVRSLGHFMRDKGLSVDFLVLDPRTEEEKPQSLIHLTYLAKSVEAAALSAVIGEVAQMELNVERVNWVSRKPLQCIELTLSQSSQNQMEFNQIREQLFSVAFTNDFDLAIQKENLSRRAKRLIVMDMDSTLIQQEVIDEIADFAGVKDKVAEITERAMQGELEFREALYERVALLKGLPQASLDEVQKRIQLTPGVENLVKTLKKLGYKLAVVSGGFSYFTDQIRQKLGLDYSFANTLEIENGELTGRLTGNIVDRAAKALILSSLAQQEGIPLEQTVAVGDGANDLDMLETAGLGIAFNAKPAVKKQAGAFLSQPGLDSVLYLLGIRGFDI